jgi:hypothetical protein
MEGREGKEELMKRVIKMFTMDGWVVGCLGEGGASFDKFQGDEGHIQSKRTVLHNEIGM